MKLNWFERLVVNNPLRVMAQRIEIKWFKSVRRGIPGQRVLEIGCGRGAGAALIHRNFHPGQLYAFDLDFRMVQLSANLRFQGLRPVWGVADATALPVKSETIDAIFGFGFLHHVPDWRQAVSEVRRVLKPGGVYYMEELYPESYQNVITGRLFEHPVQDRFRGPDLKQVLDDTGFNTLGRLEHRWLGLLGVFQVRDSKSRVGNSGNG